MFLNGKLEGYSPKELLERNETLIQHNGYAKCYCKIDKHGIKELKKLNNMHL
jgi:hypothetical protein